MVTGFGLVGAKKNNGKPYLLIRLPVSTSLFVLASCHLTASCFQREDAQR